MIIDFATNKKQEYAMNAVQSEKYRFILFGGAIRGGKTFWGLSTLLILCQVFPKSRWCIVRQSSEKIRTTTIPSFANLEPSGELKRSPFEYHHPNGSTILFKSENFANDKELNWMRGLEVNGFLFEELNECQHQTLIKAQERAGSWTATIQPKPIILATCNPTNGWVKELIYDKHKDGTLNPNWLYIQSKITDNILNLDPDYVEALKDMPRYEYEVFVEGNWDLQLKTGGEFYKQFELEKHVKPIFYNPNLPIHISLDENVNPYLSCSIWQLDGKSAYQIHEIALRNPVNTLRDMAKAILSFCNKHNHEDIIYIYGDRTSLKEDTKLEKGQNFFTILRSYLEEKYQTRLRLPSSNPSVSMSGAFLNAIYEYNYGGIEIIISETCKISISDYIESKEDADGTIKKEKVKDPKTLVTYEKNGHFSDNKRYIIAEAFKSEYFEFQKKPTIFNPTIVHRKNTKRR